MLRATSPGTGDVLIRACTLEHNALVIVRWESVGSSSAENGVWCARVVRQLPETNEIEVDFLDGEGGGYHIPERWILGKVPMEGTEASLAYLHGKGLNNQEDAVSIILGEQARPKRRRQRQPRRPAALGPLGRTTQ
jgi:hypothetical protein